MKAKKHVIVTGGAKGIGEACSKIFARENYNVTILDVDEVSGKQLAGTIGTNANFISCDVSRPEEVKSAFTLAVEHFGEIDTLVNNAGINPYGTVTSTTEDVWDLVMNINLKSYFLCSKQAILSMQKNGGGVVINISSVQAYISQANVAAYTTAKTALLGLTRSIAVDFAPSIRCMAICPGTIDTPMLHSSILESPDPQAILQECHDMHLTKRIGTTEEVGELVAFVASSKGGFMTGQAIRVDGGLGVTIPGSKKAE